MFANEQGAMVANLIADVEDQLNEKPKKRGAQAGK
jgi:hypothetical protein